MVINKNVWYTLLLILVIPILLILVIAISFGLFFALPSGVGKWDVDELFSQKIEGTSKILYKYSAWGGRDSHASGFIILDSTEPFKVNTSNNLPIQNLQEIPSKTIIKGVSAYCDNSCGANYYKTAPIFSPVKKEITLNQGFKLINNVYQFRGFEDRTIGLWDLQFQSFKETKDSLFFYNLDDVESVDRFHVDSLKFKKIDVDIVLNKNKEVVKIIIEDLVVNKNSDEIISSHTHFLTPKTKLYSDSFSDYGIFKDVLK